MTDYRYTLTLTIQSPVLSQVSGALGFGYDAAMLRDGGVPALPGSLVRGNLRAALEHFLQVLEAHPATGPANDLQAKDIDAWFGARAKPAKANAANELDQETMEGALNAGRAALLFDYTWRCEPFAAPVPPHYRIAVDPATGTVLPGALAAIEAVRPPGEALVFEGGITARFEMTDEAEKARRWLEKAARYLPALGALKGVGYGRVLAAALRLDPMEPPEPAPYEGSLDRIGLSFLLDRPFCVAEPHPGDSNLYESQELLPGGVLKGALAARLSGPEIKALQFDRLVFTHALPAPESAPGRGRVLPLSLAWVGEAKADTPEAILRQRLRDLALPPAAGGTTQRAEAESNAGFEAPKFQIDWKRAEWRHAGRLIAHRPGPYDCARRLEVHAEIDPATGQSADQKLYSRDCVDPEGLVWCADVDLAAVVVVPEQDRPAVVEGLLAALAQPLTGIGKTKAVAAVGVQGRAYAESPALVPIDGQLYVVSLQTPAVLFTDADARMVPATGGDDGLRAIYKKYWHTVSNGALRLNRYFAAQELRGGRFLLHRYLKAKGGDGTARPPWLMSEAYQPFWLTQAGSVFVLEVVGGQEEAAKRLLGDWRRRGLPGPDGRDSALHWPYNPYIRENGYGEIRVNDRPHLDWRQPSGADLGAMPDCAAAKEEIA